MVCEEKEISMEELHFLMESGEFEIEIETPDGYSPVTHSMVTGLRDIVELYVQGSTTPLGLSTTHPVEVVDERQWAAAGDLKVGDLVLTPEGPKNITSLAWAPPELCYDLRVDHWKHRFFAEGISVHNCYGGSAYTVSRNMNESVEQAQEKIDAFFAELPDLSQYMARAKRNALTTGFVVNLFGRSRSVQEDIAKGRSGIGYAERTALNHPIQSTSADWMKLAMIRVSDYIKEKGLNPLWGDEIMLVIDPKETTYLDIILTMLASVHDEVVYLMLDELIESIVPEVYDKMQINDVIKHHGVGYTLEMDTEYDETRSWTSTKKMDQAKVYLLKYLDGIEGKGGKKTSGDRTHNGYTIPFEKLTRPLIDRLQNYSNELHPDAKTFILAVVRDTQLYKHEKVFPQEFLEQLAIEFSVTLSPVHID